MEKIVKERDYWIDSVKVFACILVVLGHFFQSMVASGVFSENALYSYFNKTIYYFHVPLFFICSGYLYQKYSKVDSIKSWAKNAVKKLMALGIPYFVFSIITWTLKTIFSDSVNTQADGLLYTLFIKPLSPYWYLYALYFIFLFTPTFSKKTMGIVVCVVVLLLKTTTFFVNIEIYVLNIILQNWIWFVLGMCLYFVNATGTIKRKNGLIFGLLLLLIFIGGSIIVYTVKFSFASLDFLLGILGCAATIVVARNLPDTETFKKGAKLCCDYTLPVFLMHTIFAAALRSLLFKVGITLEIVHIVGGLLISFAGPILVAMIMCRVKWLDFVLYPNKYIGRKKESNE